jgi:ADP-heptose:LPS heptosyltransferase
MLLARHDGLGDAVLSFGLLRGLRAGAPDAHMVLAVAPGFVSMFRDCPWIDTVIPCLSLSEAKQRQERVADVLERQLQIYNEAMGGRQPDIGVDLSLWPHPDTSTSPFIIASGAATTIVALDSWMDGRTGGWVERAHTAVCRVPMGHEVERYRAVAGALGVEAAEPRWWDLRPHIQPALAALGQDAAWRARPKIVLGLGATAARRRWRLDRFLEIARRAVHAGLGVYVLGGPELRSEGAAIADLVGTGVVNGAGALSIVQSAAVLTPNDVYVGNDTGTLHIAAAAGCACVEISSHPADGDQGDVTSPLRFGPYNVPAALLRPRTAMRPCIGRCNASGPHCIDAITVEDVWSAAQQLVSRAPAMGLTAGAAA